MKFGKQLNEKNLKLRHNFKNLLAYASLLIQIKNKRLHWNKLTTY